MRHFTISRTPSNFGVYLLSSTRYIKAVALRLISVSSLQDDFQKNQQNMANPSQCCNADISLSGIVTQECNLIVSNHVSIWHTWGYTSGWSRSSGSPLPRRTTLQLFSFPLSLQHPALWFSTTHPRSNLAMLDPDFLILRFQDSYHNQEKMQLPEHLHTPGTGPPGNPSLPGGYGAKALQRSRRELQLPRETSAARLQHTCGPQRK